MYVRQLQHNLNTELLFRNVSCATQMGQLASSGQSLKVDDCSRTQDKAVLTLVCDVLSQKKSSAGAFFVQ